MHKATTGPVVALSCALVLACALAGCGASTPTAPALVHDTLAADSQIASGKLSLSLSLSGSGGGAAGTPLSLSLSGPFESRGAGKPPSFHLDFSILTGGQSLSAGAVYADEALYLELAGSTYEVPHSASAALASQFEHAAQGSGKGPGKSGSSPLGELGLSPGDWLEDPVVEGTQTIEGMPVVHVHGRLNVGHLLEDAGGLSGVAGSLGGAARELGDAGAVASLLSASGRAALSRSVKSASVDLYAGAEDHLLRALSLSIHVATDPSTRAALLGLEQATLALNLHISELNQPQHIRTPPNPISLGALAALAGG